MPLQAKHNEAEPKSFLSHILHLLKELDGLIPPGVGVTGSAGAVAEVVFILVFDVAKDVLDCSTVSRTIGRLDSRGSAPENCLLWLSPTGPPVVDIASRSHEESEMLDETAACCGREDGLFAARPCTGFRMSLGDSGGE